MCFIRRTQGLNSYASQLANAMFRVMVPLLVILALLTGATTGVYAANRTTTYMHVLYASIPMRIQQIVVLGYAASGQSFVFTEGNAPCSCRTLAWIIRKYPIDREGDGNDAPIPAQLARRPFLIPYGMQSSPSPRFLRRPSSHLSSL